MGIFKLTSDYAISGDQPKAISKLVDGLEENKRNQVLLGVTGSGKTFTMANIIAKMEKPAVIMAHNKTLAAQIYSEMKEFFPENAVEYFVSYYDYYQPEAYIPRTDVYIEKDSSINEQIDLLRHSATRSLLERKDVIVVSSVSCIYGLGSPELYSEMVIHIKKGQKYNREDLIRKLVSLQYERNDIDFTRGHFRVRGDVVDIFPAHYEEKGWRVEFFGDEIDNLFEFDSLTGHKLASLSQAIIYANSHYVTPRDTIIRAIEEIKQELVVRLEFLYQNNMLVEAQRLKQRTEFDIEMLMEGGMCKGIENYSRFLSGKKPGEPPPTLFEYLPKDAILFVDESHVTVPQVRGMFNGDRARKQVLVDYGFRLPSALDNRPLNFDEWNLMRPRTIFVSATPGPFELEQALGDVAEQIIRPTGLTDPICEIRPIASQIDDLIGEINKVTAKGYRVLVTTLTKKMSESLTEYLQEQGIKVCYLHSEINTLERVEIIRDLRKGIHDVLVGINLLREGLDIPECGLVAILDADKEGFLRSETALIQTIGRAARNVDGKVILYADNITRSIKSALDETNRRRKLQTEYNQTHGITPQSIKKNLSDSLSSVYEKDSKIVEISSDKTALTQKQAETLIKKLKKNMLDHASNLEFEKAAKIRDELKKLEEIYLLS